MADIKKPIIMLLMVSAFFLTACEPEPTPPPHGNGGSVLIRPEQRKLELMDQIRQKYESPQAHYELARIYLAQGLWNKAEFEFKVTMDFDPVNRRARSGMVKAILDGGNKARADLTARQLIAKVSNSSKETILLGRAFLDEGLDEFALLSFQQAAQTDIKSAEANKYIGYYYLKKGDKIRAEDFFRRSFQLDPYQADVAGELGKLGVVIQTQDNTKTPVKKQAQDDVPKMPKKM